jgi:hypothetical protein
MPNVSNNTKRLRQQGAKTAENFAALGSPKAKKRKPPNPRHDCSALAPHQRNSQPLTNRKHSTLARRERCRMLGKRPRGDPAGVASVVAGAPSPAAGVGSLVVGAASPAAGVAASVVTSAASLAAGAAAHSATLQHPFLLGNENESTSASESPTFVSLVNNVY